MQTTPSKCLRLQHCLSVLATDPLLTTRQQRWVEEQQYETGKCLENCSDGKQLHLRIRLALLRQEEALYGPALASLHHHSGGEIYFIMVTKLSAGVLSSSRIEKPQIF